MADTRIPAPHARRSAKFRLPPERWNAFVEMLDRSPVEKPRLRRLLTEPSILER